MDAAAGHCLRAAKFYEDLRSVFDLLFADTCTGDVLDEWAAQKQVYRKAATSSYYVPVFDGVAPADLVGDRFMAGGYYFVVVQDKLSAQRRAVGSGAQYYGTEICYTWRYVCGRH